MGLKRVQPWTTRLVDDEDKLVTELLWGDPVHVPSNPRRDGDWIAVRARGQDGWVEEAHLTAGEGLLELYVIDVGQGDGILMRTPDDRWHLIDAGVRNSKQMTRKGTANFLRWKFQDDLQQQKVALRTLILSHPDADHYGGMIDVLSGKLADGRAFEVSVDRFLHPGVGRFPGDAPLGRRIQAELRDPPAGVDPTASFITELLDGAGSFRNPARPFTEDFAEFAALVGSVPGTVQRLNRDDGYLPGYGPADGSEVTIHVLGPILERLKGNEEGYRWLGSLSKTSNGHSIVLRVEYGRARLLLTGDLNTASQELLLGYVQETEFAVDVAKACHHGAEDVATSFIQAMQARVTVISSGDNEDYAHPRPVLMGASAHYGREAVAVDGEVLPPLVYSTELARSVRLAPAEAVRVKGDDGPARRFDAAATEVKPEKGTYQPLTRSPVATDLVYGLVNVRTDGRHILTATLEERGKQFDVKVIRAGTTP